MSAELHGCGSALTDDPVVHVGGAGDQILDHRNGNLHPAHGRRRDNGRENSSSILWPTVTDARSEIGLAAYRRTPIPSCGSAITA